MVTSKVNETATQSFYEDMWIDTPEKVANIERAFDEADRRGPIDTSGAHKPIRDPEFFRKLMEKYK